MRRAGPWPLFLLILLFWCPAAQAREPRSQLKDEQAVALLHSGMAHKRAAEYPQAVADFRRAYELSPRPNYLYLIGEAEQEAGHVAEAIVAYQQYLKTAPEAPDRQLVLDQLDALKQQPRVPPPAEPKATAGPGALVGADVPPPPPPGPFARTRSAPEGRRRQRRSFWHSPWPWVTVSALVLVGAAVGIGVALRPTEPNFLVAPGALP